MQGSEGKSINLFIFMYVQTKTTHGSNTKSMLAHILHVIIQYMRPNRFPPFFFLKYVKSSEPSKCFFSIASSGNFWEKKVRKQTTHRQKKGRGGKKRKTSIVLLENDMLCSSSVISHGVEWTAGLLAWLTFWHPQRQRSLSGTSQETAGLYGPTPDKTEVQEKHKRQLEWIVNSGRKKKSKNKWKKKFCSHLQMKCSCVSFLASTRSKIGKMECVCVTVEEFCLLCDHLLWPKTRLGGNSTFYSVWLNVELIFNIWHFTQIIRPKTWPWGIFADCFFSTSATVELLFLKKAFELDEVITSDGCGHPDLEQLRESDIMIVEPC